jgi:transcriptional regulator with XRE-family HTH domain
VPDSDAKSGRVLNLSATVADVDDENDTETGAPVRLVTVSQVVAWNVARYRRAAGLTQRELGRLLGWSNGQVSDAERSWKGERVREFDADELARLSLVLGVPLIAFFLPPEGDGDPDGYALAGPDGGKRGMRDLMALVVMPDSDSREPQMYAYRDRLQAAGNRYLSPEWADELAGWMHETEPDDRLAERAAWLRARQAQLRESAAELGDLASAIENRRRRT